ncbi:MAG TPA: sialidase family protein, partial [Gaiellaceae bacterium]|nr:sialidase family protein [Gaiellaceae bacterium]
DGRARARSRDDARELQGRCVALGQLQAGTEQRVFLDVDEEAVLGPGSELPEIEAPTVELPRVVATARAGATIVAVVDRRPPLAVSRDGGTTWTEAGGGLPAGFAVAIAEDDPDRMLYAARNRLYVSTNGGVFWRALTLELPDVSAVAWID